MRDHTKYQKQIYHHQMNVIQIATIIVIKMKRYIIR